MGINRGSTVTPTGGPRARSLVALAACRELQVKPDPHARELARWRSAPRLSLYSATLSDKHDGLARGCASTHCATRVEQPAETLRREPLLPGLTHCASVSSFAGVSRLSAFPSAAAALSGSIPARCAPFAALAVSNSENGLSTGQIWSGNPN